MSDPFWGQSRLYQYPSHKVCWRMSQVCFGLLGGIGLIVEKD